MDSGKSVFEKELLERRSVLGPAYRLFYDEPLVVSRGQDVWLFDETGREYLDAYNNVPVVGHCHPRVVKALSEQSKVLNTHTRYLHPRILDYADRLLSKFPGALDRVMFTCTGSEANDLALRVAMAATGNRGVVVTHNAYHGGTVAVAEISPSLAKIGSHVRTVSAPGQVNAASFISEIHEAIASLADSGLKPAALIVDTVFASDGIHVPENDVLAAAAREIGSAGGLFVADEVQAGFARTGHWWGFEHGNVRPDIVSLGKPMGNGYPLAGLVMRADLANRFAEQGRYFNTFGGTPVAAAAGLAVLDVIEGEGLLARARAVGAELKAALSALDSVTNGIADIRGAGLYWGVELVENKPSLQGVSRAQHVANELRRRGVLIGLCGKQGNVLKIRPPLTFTSSHVSLLVDSLSDVLRSA